MNDITRRQLVICSQTIWMSIATVGLAVLNALSLERFFVVSFIGLLVVVEVTAASSIRPPWRRRLRIITLLALCLFGYFFVRSVLETAPNISF